MNPLLDNAWCTYRTEHPTGHFYCGKGRTALVEAGKYQGSGVRFNLALTWEGFEPSTWSTKVVATFATEEEAYAAEELMVAHESLANPFCMNMMCGGRKGKYKTPSTLLRRFRLEAKRRGLANAKLRKKEREQLARIKAGEAKAAAALKLKAAKEAVKAAAKRSARVGFTYTAPRIAESLPLTRPRYRSAMAALL